MLGWDEVNLIVAGGNYGWPVVEGVGDTHGGSVWIMTNNTDGRGTPKPGDDRILALR